MPIADTTITSTTGARGAYLSNRSATVDSADGSSDEARPLLTREQGGHPGGAFLQADDGVLASLPSLPSSAGVPTAASHAFAVPDNSQAAVIRPTLITPRGVTGPDELPDHPHAHALKHMLDRYLPLPPGVTPADRQQWQEGVRQLAVQMFSAMQDAGVTPQMLEDSITALQARTGAQATIPGLPYFLGGAAGTVVGQFCNLLGLSARAISTASTGASMLSFSAWQSLAQQAVRHHARAQGWSPAQVPQFMQEYFQQQEASVMHHFNDAFLSQYPDAQNLRGLDLAPGVEQSARNFVHRIENPASEELPVRADILPLHRPTASMLGMEPAKLMNMVRSGQLPPDNHPPAGRVTYGQVVAPLADPAFAYQLLSLETIARTAGNFMGSVAGTLNGGMQYLTSRAGVQDAGRTLAHVMEV